MHLSSCLATTLLGKVRHLLPVVTLLRFFLRELILECSDTSSSIMWIHPTRTHTSPLWIKSLSVYCWENVFELWTAVEQINTVYSISVSYEPPLHFWGITRLLDMGPVGIIFTVGEKGSGVKKQKQKRKKSRWVLKVVGKHNRKTDREVSQDGSWRGQNKEGVFMGVVTDRKEKERDVWEQPPIPQQHF